jgi:hypothetical protein
MAFGDFTSRDSFFVAVAAGTQVVSPGTAMGHVLAVNLGIWGDENVLKRDAAAILLAEVGQWAKANGLAPLTELPIEVVMNNRDFNEAFRACREVNRRAIQRAYEGLNGGRVTTSPAVPSEYEQYTTERWTETAYGLFYPRAAAYRRLLASREKRVAEDSEDFQRRVAALY